MARPKLTVRVVMALVALISLVIWGEQMWRRRDHCLAKSLEHRTRLFMINLHITHSPLLPEREDELRRTDPHAAWHLAMSDAYLRSAARPWQSEPNEPPEPREFPPLKAKAP